MIFLEIAQVRRFNWIEECHLFHQPELQLTCAPRYIDYHILKYAA